MTIIYLKDGSLVKVSEYDKISFDKEWVHIYSVDYRNCRHLRESYPASNILSVKNE